MISLTLLYTQICLQCNIRINTIVNFKYPWKKNGNHFILEVSSLKSNRRCKTWKSYIFKVSSCVSMYILITLLKREFLKNRLYLFVLYGCSPSKITPGRRFPWYRLKIKAQFKRLWLTEAGARRHGSRWHFLPTRACPPQGFGFQLVWERRFWFLHRLQEDFGKDDIILTTCP